MDLQYLKEEAEASLEYYIQKPWTRNPMEQLYRDYFYFHFYNLPNPRCRLGCYICYHVEGTQTHLPMPFAKGVFENQFYPKKSRHAELCFISWFRNQKKFLDKKLSPGEKYRVTWYMSWSPCINCVNAVIRFLEENENMDLTVFVARLYYSYCPEHRRGLRRLHQAGAQMNIMSSEEFEYCWETFVNHRRTPFFPWDDMDANYQRLSMTLEAILQVRNPMKRLYPGIFSFHFCNLIYANGRNSSYLCFEVEGVQYHSPFTVSFHRGVFRNQVYENKSYHAEVCFLSWFKANKLSPGEHYHVTWFLSWSPCASCAEETANFLQQHRNVTLRVFTARLYYFWNPAFQQGLRKLHCLGAQVKVMSFHDFNYCWENFVYNRYMRFRRWKKVHKNYKFLSRWLKEVLSC